MASLSGRATPQSDVGNDDGGPTGTLSGSATPVGNCNLSANNDTLPPIGKGLELLWLAANGVSSDNDEQDDTSEDVDVESVLVEAEKGIYVQPNLVRPMDIPSDHPDKRGVFRVLFRAAGQYIHRESPSPGSSWNGKELSFNELKLAFSDDESIPKPPDVSLRSSLSASPSVFIFIRVC
ncbi:hypothetical protein MTO96_051853 [Rhipicephalus appendiculatus]